MFTLGQCQIGDSACQATIAVIEGMQCDKPEVRDAGAYQRVQFRLIAAGFELLQKIRQCLLQSQTWRGLEMHGRPIKLARHHLHRLIPPQ